MKNIAMLAEFQLHAIKKPLIWMIVLMGPAEFALMMLGLVHDRGPLFGGQHILFGWAIPILALCMVLAAVLNFSVTLRQNGRSRFIYTLMTLPVKRDQLYTSGVISGALAVWSVMAAQAAWFLVLYFPTGWAVNIFSRYYIKIRVNAGALPAVPDYTAMGPGGLFVSMTHSPIMRMLLPMSLLGLLIILVSVIGPVACLQAIAYRRGGFKIAHIFLFGASTLLMLITLGSSYERQMSWNSMHSNLLLCAALLVQLVFAVIAAVSAWHGLKTAKNL